MTTWTYYYPTGDPTGWSSKDPSITSEAYLTVGARELELLLRARRSSTGTLVLPHDRERNAERMAARRLVERGLLREPNAMGGRSTGWLYFYGLTERGRTAWLRSRS